jgi:hypothetical protein
MDIIKQSPRASIAHPRFLFKGEKTYTTATKASPSIRPTCAGRLTGQAGCMKFNCATANEDTN